MRTGSLLFMAVFFLAISVIGSGCASIVSKSTYPVEITSEPSGAEFTVVDHLGTAIHSGTTPQTVPLKAGRGYFKPAKYTVEFRKDGYARRISQVRNGLDLVYYVGGNFLCGGFPGWVIVDPISGAMWTLDDVHVVLDPIRAAQSP